MKIQAKMTLRGMMTPNHVVRPTVAYSGLHANYSMIPLSDSNSKKSCQGCELPSDDIPDSTSNSRGHNNNTPSATNNNQPNSNSSNGSAANQPAATPNSTIELGTPPNPTNGLTNTNIISADSSVASSVSLDEEEETPTKIKKKEDSHSRKVSF
jgi:hypothetical protein